jgi:hypothetical protein
MQPMNARCWRKLAVLTTVALIGQMANSQQRASVPQTTTFSAPDRAFLFSYPNDFQICTAGKIDLCLHSFMPVCEADALVCVIYPTRQFGDTNFGAASFQVREIHREEMMTPDVCATPYPLMDSNGPWRWPEFLVSAEHPVETIGGVQFLHGVTGEGATSHSLGSNLYRGFHIQRCFELRVSTTATDPSVSDPPLKTLTSAQQKKLDQSMSQILHSFRFSN